MSLFSVQTRIDQAHKQHEQLVGKFNFIKENKLWGFCRRPFEKYAGVYESFNQRHTLFVWPEVYIEAKAPQDQKPGKGKMVRSEMAVQFSNGMNKFVLRHLGNDSFTWYSDWDGIVAGHRPTGYPPEHYILHFNAREEDQHIVSVTWAHDPELPEAQVFTRRV